MADKQGFAEHHASVTVNASVHQVYALFSHFNDFPKFMSFVKEVTYYDDQRSHWVAEVVGRHEWDAVNDNWVEDRQIGWRSTNGLENYGKVTFQPMGSNQTRVDVYVYYNPPAGILGDAGEKLGAGSRFENALQHDLDNFARMVNQAPPGALDPESSNYLFHSGSAAAKGTTTGRQDATMGDSNMNQNSSPTSGTGSAYTQGAGAGYTSGTGSDYSQGAGTSPDYIEGTEIVYTETTITPITDQDIINDPNYTGTSSEYRERNTPMPPSSGTSNPVMPSSGGASNPVMPSSGGASNPVMPSREGASNPVMPPESGTENPVMPPERDHNA